MLKIKKHFPMYLSLFVMLNLIIFSSDCFTAAQNAFSTWGKNIVPSLLPFLICINILKSTSFVNLIGTIFSGIMKPLFNLPGETAFALIMGITSGYPTGAKITTELYNNGKCSKYEAERLLAFSNTSGPLFIISSIGIATFKNYDIGITLLIAHILGSITVGLLLRGHKSPKNPTGIISRNTIKIKDSTEKSKNIPALKTLGETISDAITDSITTLFMILGYVIFFAIICQILIKLRLVAVLSHLLASLPFLKNIPTTLISGTSLGIFEVTNGITNITQNSSQAILYNIQNSIIGIPETLTLCAVSAIIGFGGLSVLMQVSSITSKSKLSLKPYLIGKLLHGILSGIYTYLLF